MFQPKALDSLTVGIQWHITAKCQNRCLHCYVSDQRTYKNELKKELSGKQLIESLKRINISFAKIGKKYKITFSGGDPLLRKDIWKLLEFLHKKGHKKTYLMGNYNLLDADVLKKLKKLGVSGYQQSIDGLQDTHDKIRGKGSFLKTLKAVEKINKAGLTSMLMFTLNKLNSHELPEVMEIVAKAGVNYFEFDRCVPIGSGKNITADLTSKQYKELLIKTLKKQAELEKKGFKTHFGAKSSLWALLIKELGLWQQAETKDKTSIFAGCSAGISNIAILADGTIVPCRRMPIKLGNILKDDLTKIMGNHQVIKDLKSLHKFKKCSRCQLRQFCRGCPAMAYALTEDYHEVDPHCWL